MAHFESISGPVNAYLPSIRLHTTQWIELVGTPSTRPTTTTQPSTQKGDRILVMTGSPATDARDTEIVRTGRNLPSCKLPKYPIEIVGSVGTMVDGSPMVCGGRHYDISTATNQCYYLENGRFKPSVSLPENRFNAAAIGIVLQQ